MAALLPKCACGASLIVLACFSIPIASAATAVDTAIRQAQQTTTKIAAAKPAARERQDLSRALASKWGYYVQRVYGVQAAVWGKRMAPNLAAADLDNLRNALARDTFEGAMAELGGAGAKLSDDRVIDVLAAANGRAPTPKALGALNNDLVYTPIAPCRIVDTRNTAGGAIAANTTRNFVAINSANFSQQGGSGTNCGTLGLNATAVAINLTAVAPGGAGYATAYSYGTSQPVVASLNYAAGDIVNNALIVQIPNPLGSYDFTLYTFAGSHYVADIVGYFAPPVATALQCVGSPDSFDLVAPGAEMGTFANACPAGYTQTGTNCESTSGQMYLSLASRGYCIGRNNGTTTATLRATVTCCRVPGR
jgi:hypothetical protein